MSHRDLVAALREIEGLREVGSVDHPQLHFRGRAFLHFHADGGATYADVRFGTGDFEEVPASTSAEREALLARVEQHVRRIERTRKVRRRASRD